MINLFLAGIWLLLGIIVLANPWNNADVRQEMFGWFCLAMAAYNVIRWRLQVMARRRNNDWRPVPHDEPHPPKVTNPEFDFSDKDKEK